MTQLLPIYRQNLRESTLTDETIAKYDFRSVSSEEAAQILQYKKCSGGWMIKYPDSDFLQIRLDEPIKSIRYASPKGMRLDIFVTHTAKAGLADIQRPLYFTEGIKKCLSIEQLGLSAIGLTGVYGFKCKKFKVLALKNRICYVLFDSDKNEKWQVLKAEKDFAKRLSDKGAVVKIVNLDPKLGKGVDDVIKSLKDNGNLDNFKFYIDNAEDYIVDDLDLDTEVTAQEPLHRDYRPKILMPSEYLPEGFLLDYVNFVEPLSEAPAQYHVSTALSMASTVLERHVFLSEGTEFIFANLYQIIIGDSGMTRKSTATRTMLYKFLSEIDKRYLLGSLFSLECLIEAFRFYNCHTIYYDELRSLVVNEEKGYGKGLITFFTAIWDCPPIYRVDLKNIKPEERTIEDPTLNILACTTPDWLQLKEADVLGGFLGRFLPIFAENTKKRIAIRDVVDEIALKELIDKLLDIVRLKGQYYWDDDARDIFEEIYNQIRDDFDNEVNKALIQPYYSRIDTHIKKLCMVFDACSPNPTFQITKDNVLRAYKLMQLVTQYYKIMLGKLAFSWTDKKEQQLLTLIEDTQAKGLQHSDALRHLRVPAKTMRELIDTLTDKELITVKDIKTNAKDSKKPKKIYKGKQWD